jgi:hypothetical protein
MTEAAECHVPSLERIGYHAKCCGLTLLLATTRAEALVEHEASLWLLLATAARAKLEPESICPIRVMVRGSQVVGLTDGTLVPGRFYLNGRTSRVRLVDFHTPACEAIRFLCEHAGPEVAAEMTAGYATWCRSRKTAPPGSVP